MQGVKEGDNYIRLMSQKGHGYPMLEPDTVKRNWTKQPVRLGDVGFFDSGNLWTTLWNVFDQEGSDGYNATFGLKDDPKFRGDPGPPTEFSPWDGSEPRFTPVPSLLPKGVIEVHNRVEKGAKMGITTTTSPVDGEFHVSCTSGSGAVLIVPHYPTMSAFSQMSMPNIEECFEHDHPHWVAYARKKYQMKKLTQTNLALITAVANTSYWALASYVTHETHTKLEFSVHTPVVHVSAGLWGSWKQKNNVFAFAGPHWQPKGGREEESAEHVLQSVVKRAAANRDGEVTSQKDEDFKLESRPADQCVFVRQLYKGRTPQAVYLSAKLKSILRWGGFMSVKVRHT